MDKIIGRCLWFDVKKGYGFIKRKNGSDVFVHYSKITGPPGEFKILQEGDIVSFEIFLAEREDSRRPQAKDVEIIQTKEEADSNEILQEK